MTSSAPYHDPADTPQEAGKRAAGEAAMDWVQDGARVGLGTGSTVKYFLLALGQRVRDGLHVQGVSTSQDTTALAERLHIPLLPENEAWTLDMAVDGADEVDPHLHAIKGGGGALLREKIVAAAARTFLVLVDHTKCVPVLGTSMPLPVEITPFGWPNTARHLQALCGTTPTIRTKQGTVFRTDEGHYILDLPITAIDNPAQLEAQINLIPGVVENGLFVNRASTVIVGSPDGVQIKHRP